MKSDLNSQRVDWVDILRALLIIFVVAGHATSPVGTYVYLFHVPALFMLSGFVYNGRKYNIIQFIKRKIFTILLPAILINIVYIAVCCVLQTVGLYHLFYQGNAISFWTRIELLIRWLGTTDLGGATWFLFVLFEVEILFHFAFYVQERVKFNKIIPISIILFTCISQYLLLNEIVLPYLFDLAFVAYMYYGLGWLIKESNILTKIDFKIVLPISVIITVCFVKYYGVNLPMNWPTRSFSNLFVQLVSCLSATYTAYFLALVLNQLQIRGSFIWLGRHTYSVLILHFFIFRIIYLTGFLLNIYPITALQCLVPMYIMAYNGRWIGIVFLTVAICSLISYFAEKNTYLNYLINAKLH